ncbi:hypothetical protein [Mesomycoplasma ovipneumoniae]|uniref:hypothetical protein n=1 Tax=Mesomycoplasma ovipneumoniae TaxID=29562 RepID=UPI002079A3F6|nr:hypothetical protein [Mesomycoplasma ovipneumoniae]MCN0158435.1 hypothetical protein [Mesomycoplasma ovipneumoniae]
METDKKIKFLKKEIQYWQELEKSNYKNFITDVYKKFSDRFGGKALNETANYEDGLAEFLTKNKEAYYHLVKKEMPHSATHTVDNFLFGKDEKLKNQVNRLSEEERLKWIEKLGKTGCNLMGECESSWKSIEDISWQIVEENMEFRRINLKYKQYDFSTPEDQMDYKTKKAWGEYLELANNLSYPKMDPQKAEKIVYNNWVQTNSDSDVLDFDSIKSWGKNSADVLEHILQQNKKIYRNMPQTAYEIFSMYEPKSNFNLIDNLINKYWEKYQDILYDVKPISREQVLFNYANDIKSGKIHEPEVEFLGFNRVQKLDQVENFEEPKMKMRM